MPAPLPFFIQFCDMRHLRVYRNVFSPCLTHYYFFTQFYDFDILLSTIMEV